MDYLILEMKPGVCDGPSRLIQPMRTSRTVDVVGGDSIELCSWPAQRRPIEQALCCDPSSSHKGYLFVQKEW